MSILVSPSLADKWQSALAHARKENVRLRLTKTGWHANKPHGRVYRLMAFELKDGELSIACECEGYKYRGICKHSARLALRLHNKGKIVRL